MFKNKYKIKKIIYDEDKIYGYKLLIKRWWFPIYIPTQYIYDNKEAAQEALRDYRAKFQKYIIEEGII